METIQKATIRMSANSGAIYHDRLSELQKRHVVGVSMALSWPYVDQYVKVVYNAKNFLVIFEWPEVKNGEDLHKIEQEYSKQGVTKLVTSDMIAYQVPYQ